MAKGKPQPTKSFRTNDEIPHYYREVRIIGDNIESKVVTLDEAKKMAAQMELDLIEINSVAKPPIIKIGDYSKHLYELKKKEKKAKANTTQLKEVQLSATIAKHDLETKAKQARKFLASGDKVKVVLTIKGRLLARREENKKPIYEFIVMLEDASVAESIKDEGNRTIAILKPKK